MTLNIRTVLVRNLQDFFEHKLKGELSWHTAGHPDDIGPPGTIRLRDAEMHEKVPGKRQMQKGVVTVDFDGYALQLHSSEEVPPLGRVTLYHEKYGSLEGPPDTLMWDRIAEAIKSSRAKGKKDVS